MPYLLKDKQCIQQITRPIEWVKKTQARVQHLLYQLFIITLAPLPPINKPDPTPCTVIYSLGVVAVLRHAQDIV